MRKPWEWCEDHIVVDRTSPFPGKWRSATSPWVKEAMEVKADRRVKFVVVRCSAQSSKTQTILNLLCYDICEDPGSTMYVMANKEDAGDFVRDRFSPTLHHCKPAMESLIRESKTSFTFTGMPLYFVGAGSSAKLQGKPMKRLYLDEVRNYDPGALETVLKRIRAYGDLAKVFIISTPGKKGDAFDREYEKGDQRTFHFPCPACSHYQQLRFEQLKAQHPETGQICKWKEIPGAFEGNQWAFDKLAPHIRYVCENNQCEHRISDTQAERKGICRNGRFIRMNPKAPADHVSFSWNALLPWWVSWRSIVEEFIHARNAARSGDPDDLEALKTFITETLGEPWKDELGVIEDFSFLELRKADYEFAEKFDWPEERSRFIGADKQARHGEHYWWVVRAFGAFGKTRLVAYGRCNSRLELEELRKHYKVPINNAVIDSGYSANEVYRFCAATGWKPMKGDDADFFLVKDPATEKIFRQMWQWTWAKPEGEHNPGKPIRVRLFRWSNPWVKDFLAEYATGLLGEWMIPKGIGRDYMRHMVAERRAEIVDSRGRVTTRWEPVHEGADDHLRDCELQILVAAVIAKQLTRGNPNAKPEPEIKQAEPAAAEEPKLVAVKVEPKPQQFNPLDWINARVKTAA